MESISQVLTSIAPKDRTKIQAFLVDPTRHKDSEKNNLLMVYLSLCKKITLQEV